VPARRRQGLRSRRPWPVAVAASVLGRHDRIVTQPADGVVWFEKSGHAPFIEEKDRFDELVRSLAV